MIETGTLLQDRFLIEKELAHGGMGAVYLATDQKFGSRVAIKERFYEDVHLAEAFAREARILNCLHHPILPHVSDYFSEGSGHFLVMEYIEGEDLSEILKREGKAFPVTDVIEWMVQLLDGLDYLHSQDPPIVHRDIKPGNLKLTSRGNLVLLDFGLAKETSESGAGAKSVFGYSRRYSSLEQIEGAGTGPRSDLFSLGATCFHLITGEPPIDVLARASAIVAGRPDPLLLASDINSQIDPATALVIHRAMALDQEQRFGSAREMSSALYAALDTEPQPQPFIPVIERQDTHRTPHTEASGAHEAVPISAVADGARHDAEKVNVAPIPAAAFDTRPSRSVRGSKLSPLLTAAIVLIALTVLGIGWRYVGSDSAEPSTEMANANEPTNNSADGNGLSAQPNEGVGDTTLAESPPSGTDETEVKEESVTDITPGNSAAVAKGSTRPSAGPGKERDISKTRAEENIRSSAKNDRSALSRRERRERLRQARRNQRDDMFEPPVSSIEMIFTGIPSERRRRYRRWRPYE